MHCTEHQQDIIQAKERFLGVFAGRRYGKTYAWRSRALRLCLSNPNFNYWYISPGYSLAIEQYEEIVAHPALTKSIRRCLEKPYPRIYFQNGSQLAFRTFERPKMLRGSGLDEVWIDEVQEISEKNFWPVVRPLVSDKRGNIGVAGQFRGKNWYYDEFYLKGQEGPDKHKQYRSWRLPSSLGMVYQSEAGRQELELLKDTMPSIVFDQEYDCIPMANQAAVFMPEYVDSAITGLYETHGLGSNEYVLGLDLGRIVDPSAIVAINCDTMTVCYEELRPLREAHQIGAEYASQICRLFGSCPMVVDTTGGGGGGRNVKPDEYVKYYRDKIPTMRPFVFSYDRKKALIEALALALEQGILSISPKCIETIKQVRSYEYTLRKSGMIDYHGPSGHQDDLVMALSMAYDHARIHSGQSGAPLSSLY